MHFATRGSCRADEVVMRMRSKMKAAWLAWLAVEVAGLVIAVHAFGWPLTLAAGFLTSVLGAFVLRNAGRDSLSALKRAMGGPPDRAIEVAPASVLRIASGVLLILPGFVSDIAGLLLLAPFVQASLAGRILTSSRQPSSANEIVDLNPNEWRAGEPRDGAAPCEPRTGMVPGEPKITRSRRLDDE